MKMTSDVALFPLEKYLKDHAAAVADFPNGNTGYFDRYISLKNWLRQNVWHLIGAATSAEDGGLYTDHSQDHFNQVIRFAGKLLGMEDQGSHTGVTPYEAYLILVAILLHDSGNVFGRAGHEKKAYQILRDAGSSVYTDNFEAKEMARLASVHGGKVLDATGGEDKDTIGAMQWPHNRSYLGVSYRPNLVAAIVRFADEICEDSSRAAMYLLENNAVVKASEVFHHYAASIRSVDVDLADKSIQLDYLVDIKQVENKVGKIAEEVYLIDEIFCRLEKMDCERRYCLRFMAEICQIHRVRASITIVRDEDMDEVKLDRLEVLLQESGYPDRLKKLSEVHPTWLGDELKRRLQSG